jgi:hypothetical protein
MGVGIGLSEDELEREDSYETIVTREREKGTVNPHFMRMWKLPPS